MRALNAFLLIAAATVVGCGGGDSPSITGVDDNPTGKTPVDLTSRVNELLAEINSTENAISQGSGGGGAPAPMAELRSPIKPLFSSSGSMEDSRALFAGVPAEDAARCTVDSTAVMYSCPSMTLPTGLVSKVSFQFLDAAGNPQFNFDTVTTAAIRRVRDLTGTVQQPLMTMDGPVDATQITNNHDDVKLSGLHDEHHVQNGTGLMIHTIAIVGRDTAFITAPTTTTNVESSSKVPYPVGGSVTAVVTSHTGSQTSVTTQVTSFDGTSTATLVITFSQGGQSRTCTYDMTSPAPPVCVGP
jgi:hypothetical protein